MVATISSLVLSQSAMTGRVICQFGISQRKSAFGSWSFQVWVLITKGTSGRERITVVKIEMIIKICTLFEERNGMKWLTGGGAGYWLFLGLG